MGGTAEKLRALGVETLAVIEDKLDPIRLYFRHRPPRVRVAVDMERTTHRVYGCPMPPYTGEYKELWAKTRINPTGEAPEPLPLEDLQAWLKRHHGFGEIPEDRAIMEQVPPRDFKIHAGHFLIDREGVIRWVHIETPIDDVSQYGQLPREDELLAAVRAHL